MDQPETNLRNKSQKIRFICDFSPPKGSDPNLIKQAEQLSTDYISIAYNPGKSVGANSAFTAYLIKKKFKTTKINTLLSISDEKKYSIAYVIIEKK